jgi:hypothetical protein
LTGDSRTGSPPPPAKPQGWLRGAVSWLLNHSTLVISVLYGYVTVLGIIYSYVLYRRFGINIFDYAELGDFLLAALRNPAALLSGGLLVVWIGFSALNFRLWLRFGSLPQVTWQGLIVVGKPSAERVPYVRAMRRALSFIATLQILFGLASIAFIYLSAVNTAQSIEEGTEPKVEVQYRSSSGSADQVTEKGLELIGATQKVVFFYDVKDNHTLVIPQTQLVSIEVPD